MREKEKLPRLKRREEKGKITAYPDRSVEDLYVLGKSNGWDTPKIVRDAVTEALLKREADLKRPADQAG
jgi:hypothetical protein